jgi:hypothetical protein
MKELKQSVKFVLATQTFGLKIEPDLKKGELE